MTVGSQRLCRGSEVSGVADELDGVVGRRHRRRTITTLEVADHQAYPVSDGPAVEVMERIENPAVPPRRATSGGVEMKRRGNHMKRTYGVHRVHGPPDKHCAPRRRRPDDPQAVATSAQTGAPLFRAGPNYGLP